MQTQISKVPKVERFFRRRQVLEMFGISNSTLYFWIKKEKFPAAVPLGDKIVGWRESDLIVWQRARMEGN